MLWLLSVAVSLGVSWFGFSAARRFVRERLRYVDAALTPGAAIVAALGAALVTYPVVALLSFLPLIGPGTAIVFGLGVGLGSRAGATDVKRGYRISDGA
jgi:hypothetical protein